MLAKFLQIGNYTRYRCATVPDSNASAAEQEVKNDQHKMYVLIYEDCETQAYNVLDRYGVKNLPTDMPDILSPIPEYIPNNWFASLSSAGFGAPTGL